MRRLRIALTRANIARSVPVNGLAPHLSAPLVLDYLRQNAPPGLAGFLALPEPSSDGAEIAWYTANPGTAAPLSSLTGSDRAAVEERLAVRLGQLATAAKTAPADIAALLSAAARYPGSDYVYAVGREPVIVLWGHDDPRAAPASVTQPPATPPIIPPAAGAWRWWALALLLLALIAAVLLFNYCTRQEVVPEAPPPPDLAVPAEPALDPELMKTLEAERSRAEELRKQLEALQKRLDEKLKVCTAADPVPAAPPGPPPAPSPEPKKVETPSEKKVDKKADVQPPKKEKPAEKKPEQKPEEKAEVPPPPPVVAPQVASKQQCEKLTPSRKKWEAPEVVFVVDGSGSMQENVGGQTRLDAAKESVGFIADHLPADVDTALVKFTDCNAVDNDYFLDRPRLKSKVNQLQPSGGTPIGRSIERAARILSPTKETVMVVVTDGDDTCQMKDPCEAARQAKATHPNLTINVVDVSGQGLGSCIAQNGGGRVLPANTAVEIQKAIKEATDQVMLPSECVKGN
jgi:outer membrane biosynthesis protein TonB